jgi:hypothetical protein
VYDVLSAVLLGRKMDAPAAVRGGVPPDVVVRSGRVVPWLGGLFARMQGSAAAVTLGRTIVVHPDVELTPSLLAHELAHVRQWQRDPLFPIRYSLATLRHGYHHNPYEVEAREAAATTRDENPVEETRERWKDPS